MWSSTEQVQLLLWILRLSTNYYHQTGLSSYYPTQSYHNSYSSSHHNSYSNSYCKHLMVRLVLHHADKSIHPILYYHTCQYSPMSPGISTKSLHLMPNSNHIGASLVWPTELFPSRPQHHFVGDVTVTAQRVQQRDLLLHLELLELLCIACLRCLPKWLYTMLYTQ